MSGWKSEGQRRALDITGAADDRTLALATPGLTPEKLEAYLDYQLAFVETLEATAGTATARLAAAEAEATKRVPEPLRKEHVRVGALVSDYCGKRKTLRVLEAKQASLPAPSTEPEKERATKLAKELIGLRDMAPFLRRHGETALTLLDAQEARLLDLHERQQKALIHA